MNYYSTIGYVIATADDVYDMSLSALLEREL